MINWQEVEKGNALLADILVISEGGWPVAIVEVKNRPGLTAEIAISIRRNLIIHGFMSPQIPFFLLVSDETGWLWVQRAILLPDDPPTVALDMRPVVGRYASWLEPGDRLSGGALELIVADWLSDLSAGVDSGLPEVGELLSQTGFAEALRGSTIKINERV